MSDEKIPVTNGENSKRSLTYGSECFLKYFIYLTITVTKKSEKDNEAKADSTVMRPQVDNERK